MKDSRNWLLTNKAVNFNQKLYQERGAMYNWSIWLDNFTAFNSYKITAAAIKKNQLDLLISTPQELKDISYDVFNQQTQNIGIGNQAYGGFNNSEIDSIKSYSFQRKDMASLGLYSDYYNGKQINSDLTQHFSYEDYMKGEEAIQDEIDNNETYKRSLSSKELLDKINNAIFTLKSSKFIIETDSDININEQSKNDNIGSIGIGSGASSKGNITETSNAESAILKRIMDSFKASTKLIDFDKLMWSPYIAKIYVPYVVQDAENGSSSRKHRLLSFDVEPSSIQYIDNIDNIEKATEVVFNIELTQAIINHLREELVISKNVFKKLSRKLKKFHMDSIDTNNTIKVNPSLIIHIKQDQILSLSKNDHDDLNMNYNSNELFGTTKVKTKLFVHWYDYIDDINEDMDDEEEEHNGRGRQRNNKSNFDPFDPLSTYDINNKRGKEKHFKNNKKTTENDKVKVMVKVNNKEKTGSSINSKYIDELGVVIDKIHESKAETNSFFSESLNNLGSSRVFLDYIPIFKYSLNSTGKDYNDLSFRIDDAFDLFVERATTLSKMEAQANRSSLLLMYGLTSNVNPSKESSVTTTEDEEVKVITVAGSTIRDLNNTGRLYTSDVFSSSRMFLQQVLSDLDKKIDIALGYNVITIPDIGTQKPESNIRIGYNLYLPFMKELSLSYLKEIIFKELVRGHEEYNEVIMTFNIEKNRYYYGFKEIIDKFRVVFNTTAILGDALDRIKQQQVEALKASSSNGQDQASKEELLNSVGNIHTNQNINK